MADEPPLSPPQRLRSEERSGFAGDETKRNGRKGDWECSRCGNRNYNFRSICNRCKEPRLLVDASTAVDSKWLPRVGDWICTGCSNNNYAFREKCNKCERPKREAAIPAVTMHRSSLPSHGNYFAREREYGSRASVMWPLSGQGGYPSNRTQNLSFPKGWRDGDWLCDCGFHNYSSRFECKNCNAPSTSAGPSGASSAAADFFPNLGKKRMASEDFSYEWSNKRLNTGDIGGRFLDPYHGYDQPSGSSYHQLPVMHSIYSGGHFMTAPSRVNLHSFEQRIAPDLHGKGVTRLRDGDWTCNNCKNHNYAFRSSCNRCKTEKGTATTPVAIAPHRVNTSFRDFGS